MSRRRRSQAAQVPTLADLGLPEESALTFEGRIERMSMMSTHLVRELDGRERPVWHSYWASGLWLILGGIGLVIAVTVVAWFA